jgi:arylsulfatase A-like enzyme
MGLYPTVCDLCRLPTPPHIQGKSLRPLSADPAAWADPVVTTDPLQGHTVRTEQWRYIRYADGSEELYDRDADPHERANLVTVPKLADLKKELAKHLPAENLPRRKERKKGDD